MLRSKGLDIPLLQHVHHATLTMSKVSVLTSGSTTTSPMSVLRSVNIRKTNSNTPGTPSVKKALPRFAQRHLPPRLEQDMAVS